MLFARRFVDWGISEASHLSLAAIGEVRLHQARLQTPEDATLAALDVLAVHIDLLLADLERGTEANVLGLDGLQPVLLPLARRRQVRLVRNKALYTQGS